MTEVRLLQLPVPLWAQAQEHTDALLREFALITTGTEVQTHEVPARLLALIQRLDAQYSGMSAPQELALRDAAEAGQPVIEELVYDVPVDVSEAAISLDRMLDEADAYCAQGQHLLTMASSPEVVRFRRWFLSQFVDQVAGKPPIAWPDWT